MPKIYDVRTPDGKTISIRSLDGRPPTAEEARRVWESQQQSSVSVSAPITGRLQGGISIPTNTQGIRIVPGERQQEQEQRQRPPNALFPMASQMQGAGGKTLGGAIDIVTAPDRFLAGLRGVAEAAAGTMTPEKKQQLSPRNPDAMLLRPEIDEAKRVARETARKMPDEMGRAFLMSALNPSGTFGGGLMSAQAFGDVLEDKQKSAAIGEDVVGKTAGMGIEMAGGLVSGALPGKVVSTVRNIVGKFGSLARGGKTSTKAVARGIESAADPISRIPQPKNIIEKVQDKISRLTPRQKEVTAAVAGDIGEDRFVEILKQGTLSRVPGQDTPVDYVAKRAESVLSQLKSDFSKAGDKITEIARNSDELIPTSEIKELWADYLRRTMDAGINKNGKVVPLRGEIRDPSAKSDLQQITNRIMAMDETESAINALNTARTIENVIDVVSRTRERNAELIDVVAGGVSRDIRDRLKKLLGDEFVKANADFSITKEIHDALASGLGKQTIKGEIGDRSINFIRSISAAAGNVQSKNRRILKAVSKKTGVNLIPEAEAAMMAMFLQNPEQAKTIIAAVPDVIGKFRFGPYQGMVAAVSNASNILRPSQLEEVVSLARRAAAPPPGTLQRTLGQAAQIPRMMTQPASRTGARMLGQGILGVQQNQNGQQQQSFPIRDRSGRIVATGVR